MRVVRQVDLKVEDAHIRAPLVRGGRVVQLVDHWLSQTQHKKSLKSCPILVGGIQVSLSDIRCLKKSHLFTLLHLQCLLCHPAMNEDPSHPTMTEEIHLSFSLSLSSSFNLSSSLHNNQRRRQSLFYLRRHSHQLFSPLQCQWGPLFILQWVMQEWLMNLKCLWRP